MKPAIGREKYASKYRKYEQTPSTTRHTHTHTQTTHADTTHPLKHNSRTHWHTPHAHDTHTQNALFVPHHTQSTKTTYVQKVTKEANTNRTSMYIRWLEQASELLTKKMQTQQADCSKTPRIFEFGEGT